MALHSIHDLNTESRDLTRSRAKPVVKLEKSIFVFRYCHISMRALVAELGETVFHRLEKKLEATLKVQ